MECNLDWRTENSALWPGVTYQIRPLKVWAFQELLAFWEAHGAEPPPGGGKVTLPPSRGLQLMAVAKAIFAEHLRNLSGLTVVREGERAEAGPETLCEETPLMPLAGEIISRLIAISEVSPAAEKN